MKRFLSLLLALLLLLGATACNQTPSNSETTPNTTTPTPTTPAQTTPEPTTPPEIVDPPVVVEPTKELTSVTVILENETAPVQTAAEELKKHLAAKGVAIVENGGFPIYLNIDASLGDDSYTITGSAVVDETAPLTDAIEFISITGGNGRGVIYGVTRFLEDYAGVGFFYYELETHSADPVAVPASISIEYTPVFEFRYTNWHCMTVDPTFATKLGLNGNINDISIDSSLAEELGGYITYGSGLHVHTLGKLTETGGPYPAYAVNPCLTDPKNLETAIKNVRAIIAEIPEANIISVSQNDTKAHCECENCAAVDAEEGSPAGTLLRFVNAIAENLEADYPDLTIDTLAYKYTRTPPKITKPRENVCVRLCTIECHFNHPLTTESCKTCTKFREDLAGWNEICDNLYIWDYTTNFSFYLAFFANLHVLRDNMQFFADNGVKGIFEQGNSSGPSGEFGELRAYLLAKLMMNPYMTQEEYDRHMDEFLAAYYGEGWTHIREYIDQLSSLANMGEPQGIYHRPTIAINANFYSILEDTITKWWDKAEAEAGDRLEYVQRSRLQWRYLQLILHPNAEIAKPFVEDVEGWGVAWREGLHYISADQDLGIRPDNWKFVKTKP